MQLRDHGVTVRGEMAVAWQALRECPWIGITGTNGKTTVTHLLHHVLNQAGLHAPMAGNVGDSAAELGLQCMDPPPSGEGCSATDPVDPAATPTLEAMPAVCADLATLGHVEQPSDAALGTLSHIRVHRINLPSPRHYTIANSSEDSAKE